MADVLITPATGLVEFKDNSGVVDAIIQLDGSGNLNITHPGGNLSIGNPGTPVYIGDGVNAVDVIFEQNGAVRALANKTLTIGATGSNVAFAGTITSALNISSGGSVTGINLNNNNLIGVNFLSFNDPGPNEGLEWVGGNEWKIYESPNDLTTNSGGNLQFVTGSTRRATFNTSGQLDLPVATGTAPFVVVSTTRVANLNVATAGIADTVSTITSSQVTTALGFTPYNATNPSGYTSNTGTVTSVSGTGTVSGLTLGGTVTSSGNLTLTGTLAVTASNFASQTAKTVLIAPNGADGVPTFRLLVASDIPTLNQNTTGTAANVTGTVVIANGGTGATTAAAARTNLGANTVGSNLFTLANPGAVTFLRVNADNTVTARTAAEFRSDIGAGTGNGTVTSVTGTAPIAVATGTTTPAISINAATQSAAGSMSAADKTKLDGIATGATANTGTVTSVTGTAPIAVATGTTTPAISINAATQSAAGSMSAADKTKLDGIATGATANTGTVTSVGGTGTVSGLTLSGTVTTSGNLTLSGTLSASIDNITDEHRVFNNMGDNHGTRNAFDQTTPSYNFGWRFVQGNTNSPGVNSASQYYSLYVGLGNDYPATGTGSYGMQLAIPRNVATPYLSIRYNESNSLGGWQKISAGYADTAGSATDSSKLPLSGGTLTGSLTLGRDLIVNGNTGGNYSNRVIIGAADTSYTLQDTNLRPTLHLHGQYPVVSLNHTVTSNTNHGPTLQFTSNGTGSQFVIGTNGTGTMLSMGYSSGTDWNPHNGIAGYNGTSFFQAGTNGYIGIGSEGDWSLSGGTGTHVPGYNLHFIGSNNATSGHAAFFDNRVNGANNGSGFLFRNLYGNHSWGIVAEYRVEGTAGTDRPSILFSHGYNSYTWSVGFGYADDQFRIRQNHGHRNGDWGTERFRIDTGGTPYFNGNVALHAGNYTNYVYSRGESNSFNWYHSDRNFPSGTLIQTTIDYSVTNGDPWVLEIRGNSYGSAVPFDIQYQGYIYADTVINHGGYSNGTSLSGLVLFNYNGKLCFWFPYQAYWQGFNVYCYTAYATYAANRVSSITDTAKPSGISKEVALSVNIRQSLHSSNYTSWAPSLTGSGASGTWGINITGTAGSAPANGGTATALNGSNYISRRGGSGNYNTDFTNTPAGSMSHQGDDYASTNNPGSGWWFLDHYRHSNSSNYWGTQVAWGWEDNANRLAQRNVQGGNWSGWVYYLNSSNYNSYSPTLTGGGASGTWSINITGNASYATTAGDANSVDGYDSTTLMGAQARKEWSSIYANGAQARRWTIARVYGTPNHWINIWQNIRIKIVQEDYSSGYAEYNLIGYYGMGNGNSWILRLKEADGFNTDYFQVSLGTVTAAGWNYAGQPTYYQDVYIDVNYYTTVRIIATTYGHGYQSTNPTDGSAGCYTVFYDSPSASDISYSNVSKANTYHFDSVILNSGNYNSYSPTLTGGGASGTWGINISGSLTSSAPQLAAATESNSIYVSAPNYTTGSPVKLLNFDWYGNTWAIGNIRSGSSPSDGFGVYFQGSERGRWSSSGYGFQVGTALGYDNPGGWGANIVAAGTYHARLRLKATSYNSSGDRETYLWLDNTVSPATGMYSSAPTFNFNGSISTVQVAGNTVLHAGNYNSYAPTLTGGGASGTWGINITGNAATATSATDSTKLPLTGGTVTGTTYFVSNLGTTSGSLSGPSLQAYATGNNSAFMSFHRGGNYAVNFGLDSDNVLRIGGWSASANRWVLDMDGNNTIPGRLTANAWTTSARNYSNEWIEFPNYSGLYSPLNGAHFYPNNATYGSWRIAGARNGWYGIYFDSGSTLMMNSETLGFYRADYGWQFYWSAGTGYVSKGNPGGGTIATILESSNYTSYSPSLTGSGASGTWNINITGSAATATDSTKVPLTGGTMTGTLFINSKLRVNNASGPSDNTYGTAADIPMHMSGNTRTQTTFLIENTVNSSIDYPVIVIRRTLTPVGSRFGGMIRFADKNSSGTEISSQIYSFNRLTSQDLFLDAGSGTEDRVVLRAGSSSSMQVAENFIMNVKAAIYAVTTPAALDIDCKQSNYFTKTINGDSTFTFSNVPAPAGFTIAYSFTLELTHTSGTVTWPASVRWPGNVLPSLTTGKTHLFMFVTDDGGSRWRGSFLSNYDN